MSAGKMTSRSFALLLTVGLGCNLGCNKGDEPSNLEQMDEQGKTPEGVAPLPADKPGEELEIAGEVPEIPSSDLPLDGDGLPIPALTGAAKLLSPGADDQRVELRLGLVDGARYRITTIGMLKLPLFERPVGFAREEDLRLGDCLGEGLGRSCLVSHSYRNFEAEPPAGEPLEQDEAAVAELETAHRIDASGLRISETAIHGTVASPAQQALSQVHRFYCVRLPSEAVGVGATWRDTCRTRIGGQIITRELVWRLAKLESTEEGTRAELEYAGRVRRIDPEGGVRTGEVKGGLLFWVDAGEPHLMRERVAFVLDAQRGLNTTTDLRYQFTKLGANDELIRTDGKPFEQSPVVLNEPRAVPPGETRDAELPADPKLDGRK
ncbi:MAG TPA: hypothetical protein VK034_29650 [Enhygromyxa sp.]|nr:hypothetical protein [Enhygromyxa sp.]